MENKSEEHFSMTFRVKAEIGKLLEQTAASMGLNKTSTLIVALHDLARSRGITVPQDEKDKEEAAA